jgi:hypothetical protein
MQTCEAARLARLVLSYRARRACAWIGLMPHPTPDDESYNQSCTTPHNSLILTKKRCCSNSRLIINLYYLNFYRKLTLQLRNIILSRIENKEDVTLFLTLLLYN